MKDVDRQFVALKAVLRDRQGRILFLRESGQYNEGANGTKFDVPGGRIEPGEKPRDALRREVREETGLCVKLERFFHTAEWRPQVNDENWQVVGTYVSARTDEGPVELSEDHDKHAWVNPENASELELISGLEEAIEAYRSISTEP